MTIRKQPKKFAVCLRYVKSRPTTVRVNKQKITKTERYLVVTAWNRAGVCEINLFVDVRPNALVPGDPLGHGRRCR